MIPINKLYTYESLERVTFDNGDRYYVSPDGSNLSSVTTILSATADNTGLMEWRAWVGDKKADAIRDEATALGSLMHTHLENYIANEPRPGGTNLIRKMARNMADVIINEGLKNVSEVWAMEEMLYYPEKYAGTADLIGIHNGTPAIMDYKTTNKMKTKDKIDDYFCQGAAYAVSHNHLFGTDIRKIVIFMVSRDLVFKEFVIEGDEFDYWVERWNTRLETFLKYKSNKDSAS